MAPGVPTWEGVVADGFAITEYPDVPRVIADLDALIAQPIRRLRRDALDRYLDEHFEQRCAASKTMTAEAAEYIPGGVQHNLAFNLPFPLVVTKAVRLPPDRPRRQRVPGLPPGRRADRARVQPARGARAGDRAAARLRAVDGPVPRVRAQARPVHRRAHARRADVPDARLGHGGVHGGDPGGQAGDRQQERREDGRGLPRLVRPAGLRPAASPARRHLEAHGVPRYVFRHTQEFFPGDLDALERTLRLNRARGGTAAVLIEPVGPESGTRPLPAGLQRGRARAVRQVRRPARCSTRW